MAAMKPYPWKCGMCYERGLAPATIPYSVKLPYDEQLFSISFPSLDVLLCSKCGNIVLNDEADEKITVALSCAAGILMPDEILRNREALGLTQEELAALLHEHPATVARWEDGGQIHNRPMDLLLRLLFKLPEVRRELACLQPQNGATKEAAVLAS